MNVLLPQPVTAPDAKNLAVFIAGEFFVMGIMISFKNPFGIASIRQWPFLLFAWCGMAFIAYMLFKLPVTIYLFLFFIIWIILLLLVTYNWISTFESILASLLVIVLIGGLYLWSLKFQPELRMYPGLSKVVVIFIQMAFSSLALIPILLICIFSAVKGIYKKIDMKTPSGFIATFLCGFAVISLIFFYTGWPLVLRYWLAP